MSSISVLCWNIGMFYVLQIFFAMNLVEKVVICCTLPQTLRRTQVLSLYCLVKRNKTNLEPLCLQTWYRPISFTTVKNTVWNFDLPRSYFHFSPKVRTSSWGATLVETLDKLRTYRENSTIDCGMWLGKHNVTICYRLLNTLWFQFFFKIIIFCLGRGLLHLSVDHDISSQTWGFWCQMSYNSSATLVYFYLKMLNLVATG